MQLIIEDKPIEYNQTMQLFDACKNRNATNINEYIYVLEHENVYTAGKSINNNNKENSIETINGTPAIHTERGGLWTWHGKGQVVVYFVYNIRKRHLSLSQFMSIIENATIECIMDDIRYNINGIKASTTNSLINNANSISINNNIITSKHHEKIDKFEIFADQNRRGFWIKNTSNDNLSKFGFMGFKVQNGFLTHGISINYDNDLKWFDYIDPCGLGNVEITSIAEIIKSKSNQDDKINLDINNFKHQIGNKLLSALVYLNESK